MMHSVKSMALAGLIALSLAGCEALDALHGPIGPYMTEEERIAAEQQAVYVQIVEDYKQDNPPAREAEILARTEELAAAGHAAAAVLAGNLYSQGYGYEGEIDHRKAFDWYLKASEAGESRAYLGLALSARKLENYGGYTPDQVFEILRIANEEQPSTGTHINLGRFHAEGFGTPRNVERAVAEFNQAASMGAEGMESEIGKLYADPAYPEFDPDRALAHFRRDQAAGSENAAFLIVQLFGGGTEGVEPRPTVVADALEPLVRKGNPRAAFLVGRLHAQSDSPIYDPERARELLDPLDNDRAHLTLAEMYALDGPARNLELAETYYRRAIAAGSDVARERLAILYIRNNGTRQQVEEVLAPLIEKGDEKAIGLVQRYF